MPQSGQSDSRKNQELLRQMTAQSPNDVINKVIKFANDDVPQYLENLQRFEQESRKIKISVS